jgi:hypothetical protein
VVVRLLRVRPNGRVGDALLPSPGVEGDRDPGVAPRARHPSSSASPATPAAEGPSVVGVAEPDPPASAVVGLRGHARHVVGVAPPHGAAPLDLPDHAERSTTGARRCPDGHRSPRRGEPEVGLPADPRRARSSRLPSDSQLDSSGPGGPWHPPRAAPGDNDVASLHPRPSCGNSGLRLLQRRHGVPAAALRAVLYRNRVSSGLAGGRHGAPRQGSG